MAITKLARVLVPCWLAALAPLAGAQLLDPGFEESVVFAGLNDPTALRFAPDGRIFVAQQNGRIFVFDGPEDTTATLFANLSNRVYNGWDRGLLGLAIHPDFPTTPYVYVLYTFDAPVGGTPPAWGDDCPNPPGYTVDGCPVSGRLSRLEAAGDVMTGPEVVLIEDWCQQYPSHSIGDLRFGPDGALYASAGDGASFSFIDTGQAGGNPCGDPPDEGGSLRAQDIVTSGDPLGLNGTIIRIDPLTGAALPDNPLFGGDPADDRIIAYGLRNPYRFTFHPVTHELWIGDVGWGDWEELDVIPDPTDAVVENFGWPCYEGALHSPDFDAVDVPICEDLYTAGTATMPYYAHDHGTTVAAFSGMAFYRNGPFPPAYRGALFIGDFAGGRMLVMQRGPGGQPDPSTLRPFRNFTYVSDVQVGPDRALWYVDWAVGLVRRVTYEGTRVEASGRQPL